MSFRRDSTLPVTFHFFVVVVVHNMSLQGLVADYGSESDSSNEDDKTVQRTSLLQATVPVKVTAGRNLLELTEASSDEEDENSAVNVTASEDPEAKMKRLPNPLLHNPLVMDTEKNNIQNSPDLSGNFSVFTNQYREAEKVKHSILEKHVKMTESPATAKGAKKQICWKFRNGKCRFGKNCKYSHDLDAIPGQEIPSASDDSRGSFGNHGNIHGGRFPAAMAYNSRQDWHADQFQEENDDDSYMANAKRKKRAGLNDTLVPSKKALGPLDQQRAVERPWTVKHNR